MRNRDREEDPAFFDEAFWQEYKLQHKNCRTLAEKLTEEEKGKAEQSMAEMAMTLMMLRDLTGREGLLGMEETILGFPDLPIYSIVKSMGYQILDGVFPELVLEHALARYYSADQDPFMAVTQLMCIRGMLYVQAGIRPDVMKDILQSMLPPAAGKLFEEAFSKSEMQREKEEIKREEWETFCQGELFLQEGEQGYFALYFCDGMLKGMDNWSIQKVLQTNYHVPYNLLFALSGEGRRRILENLSSRNLRTAVHMLKRMTAEADRKGLMFYRRQAVYEEAVGIIKRVEQLEMQGEIVLASSFNGQLLGKPFWLMMQQIIGDEEYRKARKQDYKELECLIRDSGRRYGW